MAPSKEAAPMSAFERKRLENIEANKKILESASVAAGKIVAKIPSKPKRTPSKKTRTPIKREPARPTRMSSRLAGLEADSTGTRKRSLDVDQAAIDEAKAKKMRVSDDLSLGDIVVEGKKYENGLAGLKGLVTRGAEPGVRTFTEDDVKETTDHNLKDLRLRMGNLKIYEQWVPNDIKITPQRVYALGFHPTEEKAVVFAGDKEGILGIFDASQTAPEVDDDEDVDIPAPIISAFQAHKRTITSFIFPSSDPNIVYTSSYDGSVRRLDIQKEQSVQSFAPADTSDDMPISALDMADSEPNLIYFSTLHGGVGRYDIRTPKDMVLWELADQKIGGFSLHPLQPHLIATASLDRTLKIWDSRKMVGQASSKHPVLLGEHESRLSVSHASWSVGGHIATSSYDDTIKIYDFSNAWSWKAGQDISFKAMEPTHTIRHNNQTGRWVTILKPQWQRRPGDGIQKLAIGNMNRFVDLYAADGSQLAQLDGEGITAVPSAAHFHPTVNWVAGATASGKLCLWQ